MANRHPFVPVVAGLLLIMGLGTANLAAQTRDFDFDPAGKPVQVGGAGLGQPAPEDPKPTPEPKTEPRKGKDDEGKGGERKEGEGKQAKEKDGEGIRMPSMPSFSSILPYLLGIALIVGVIILIVVLRSRRTTTPPPSRPHTPPPAPHAPALGSHAPGPGSPGGPRPVISPAARHAGSGAPGGGPVRPPVAPDPAPAPPPPPPPPPVAPIIALVALLLGAQAMRAADYTVFPSAIPVGGTVNAIVTGPNANTLTGCGVALPDSGCSLSHVVSPTQVMVRLAAGPNAMGTDPHPVRGTLRLTFGAASVNLPNAVVVGKSEQIGVAMISPHANPAPVVPPPTVINRTTVQYRTDPATKREVAALRAEVTSLRSSMTTPPSPAPTPTTPAPAAPVSAASAAPAPVASAAGGNVQLAQMQQTMLQIQSKLESTDRRIDGLVGQVAGMGKTVEAVNANNERLVKGLGVVGGYTALALRKKDQRCALVRDLQVAGVSVVNPPANCK